MITKGIKNTVLFFLILVFSFVQFSCSKGAVKGIGWTIFGLGSAGAAAGGVMMGVGTEVNADGDEYFTDLGIYGLVVAGVSLGLMLAGGLTATSGAGRDEVVEDVFRTAAAISDPEGAERTTQAMEMMGDITGDKDIQNVAQAMREGTEIAHQLSSSRESSPSSSSGGTGANYANGDCSQLEQAFNDNRARFSSYWDCCITKPKNIPNRIYQMNDTWCEYYDGKDSSNSDMLIYGQALCAIWRGWQEKGCASGEQGDSTYQPPPTPCTEEHTGRISGSRLFSKEWKQTDSRGNNHLKVKLSCLPYGLGHDIACSQPNIEVSVHPGRCPVTITRLSINYDYSNMYMVGSERCEEVDFPLTVSPGDVVQVIWSCHMNAGCTPDGSGINPDTGQSGGTVWRGTCNEMMLIDYTIYYTYYE